MTKETPCDWGDCPYNAMYSEDCRHYCGLGVDEDIAYKDACKIEHDLSDETFSALKRVYEEHKRLNKMK